jgi:hypothetical protein
MNEPISKAPIEDAIGMVEVAFRIVASYLNDNDNDNDNVCSVSDADLREIDDFLNKISWVHQQTGRVYCQALQKSSVYNLNQSEQDYFM